MERSRGNLTKKNLGKVSGKIPVSDYSLNFTQINNDTESNFSIKRSRPQKITKTGNKSSFSKAVFNWRNASVIAAILAIGVLQFLYQLTIIKNEKTQITESPATIEKVSEQKSEIKPAEFEVKKVDAVMPEKTAAPVRQRQTEIAPSKPQQKKKEASEPRAERLRRAEKILTGI